jgi:Rod binding domain-containing protein
MSSKKKIKQNDKKKVIEIIFPENLLKSMNKIYEKQNQELMNAISQEKTIPINDLLKFMYDQQTIIINPES